MADTLESVPPRGNPEFGKEGLSRCRLVMGSCQVRVHLSEHIFQSVLYSQLPHKIVNLIGQFAPDKRLRWPSGQIDLVCAITNCMWS